jgi:hypothetical protein
MKFIYPCFHSRISPLSAAFQAEYEGSIPFTRSISFPAVKQLIPGQGVNGSERSLLKETDGRQV